MIKIRVSDEKGRRVREKKVKGVMIKIRVSDEKGQRVREKSQWRDDKRLELVMKKVCALEKKLRDVMIKTRVSGDERNRCVMIK